MAPDGLSISLPIQHWIPPAGPLAAYVGAALQRWIDRFYYQGDEGAARPLSAIWKDEVPWMLNAVTATLELLATTRLRSAIRLLPGDRGEILP